MNAIRESDWKHLRQLKPVALDRYCRQILSEVERTTSNHDETSHQRYLTVYKLMRDRDLELGRMFNDMRRSNAMNKIFLLRRNGLLTDDEWGGFSDEIKNVYVLIKNI